MEILTQKELSSLFGGEWIWDGEKWIWIDDGR